MKEKNRIKITVLNGSPRANGNTATMVQAFEKGATEAGHEVSVIHVGAKKVAGCLGCQYCFTHEGTCVRKDDMTEIWKVLNQTDLLVFASPIYWWEVTAQTKAVIDRLYAHALVGFNFNKIALLFDSGAKDVYDAPISMFQSICDYLKWENVGTICIPNMEDKDSMKSSPMLEDVYKFGGSLSNVILLHSYFHPLSILPTGESWTKLAGELNKLRRPAADES